MHAAYKPWPEDAEYSPGSGAAPPIRPRLNYGETPEVGDLPRLGKRPGDCRCSDVTGVTPCSFCVAEKVLTYSYDSKYVLPGFPSTEAMGKHWFTGLPSQHPHPFQVATPAMNTGRGCNTFGEEYGAPPRYGYVEVFDFDESQDDYVLRKGIEVDWGPPKDSPEFESAMRQMKETPSFDRYSKFMKSKDETWEWCVPTEPRPWEAEEKVPPNPQDLSLKHPVDQHIARLQDWAKEEHEPWPEWPLDDVN
mmetsp:Transcript_104537/g.325988  ORF Transcript_104537/g.325988 Transcript_104537/m.325988 type:complete len:249 (-) Transcript_104537:84-830(-)